MKSSKLTCIATITLFAALAIPLRLHAQGKPQNPAQPQRYKLIDISTFGGPTSLIVNDLEQMVNGRGAFVGQADLSTPDPFPGFCFNPDCFVSHAFRWQNHMLTDLGALPGGGSSNSNWINASGLIVGLSQNGIIDPLTGAPEVRAVFWMNGKITDLGTLGGNESDSIGANDRGQIIGVASNAIPDPFSFFGATQARAFLWENGEMHDLGTLGGPDAFGQYVNNRGQVAGFSSTSYAPNPSTGIPTVDPFLWDNGTMSDLGSLGGTFGQVNDLNNRGQVVGTSNLADDIYVHGFIWERNTLTDVGTFGGDNGEADWINDSGEVAGSADFPGDLIHHGFLWKNDMMVDLGTVGSDPCSRALGINSSGQVVGGASDCGTYLHAFRWEAGGPSIDLNTLIPPNSGLQLVVAYFISDRGEIAGVGVPPGCSPQLVDTCGRAFLLIPCTADQTNTKGCEDGAMVTTAVAATQVSQSSPMPPQGNPAFAAPVGTLAKLRARLTHRYHIPVSASGPGS